MVITGFGTFRVSKRAARTGVNPRNPSEKIDVPAMKVPVFKAAESFKRGGALNRLPPGFFPQPCRLKRGTVFGRSLPV